jgi:hypothetical protein
LHEVALFGKQTFGESAGELKSRRRKGSEEICSAEIKKD